jgi:seryl-tRNA synthetase
MLDIKFIRDNPDIVRAALAHRKDTAPLDEILELDKERRRKLSELEEFRHTRKGGKMPADEGRKLRDEINHLEAESSALDDKLKDLLLRVPNIPDASVPVGSSEEDNVVLRSHGEIIKFDFQPLPTGNWGKNWGSLILIAG